MILRKKTPARPVSEWAEFKSCLEDLLSHPSVHAMHSFRQHGTISCLEHCLRVSYSSFHLCRRLGLDHRSAARGALLHDFFLYDWHVTKNPVGLHAFAHPYTALDNALRHFDLNAREKDIIAKHMWPLTLRPPRFAESLVVALADKYCTCVETLRLLRVNKKRLLWSLLGPRPASSLADRG